MYIFWLNYLSKESDLSFKVKKKKVNIPQGQLLYLHFITIFSSGIWGQKDDIIFISTQSRIKNEVFKGFKVSPALWIHQKHFRLTGGTFRPALRPLWLEHVWTPEPSEQWRDKRFNQNGWNQLNRSRIRYWGLRGDAHLLVEEDPVELSWRGEEHFFHAEFTGGDLDAGVDRSSCAARGGNLFNSRMRTKVWWGKICCTAAGKTPTMFVLQWIIQSFVWWLKMFCVSTNLSFIRLGFGLWCGLRLGHTVGCRQDHPLCELCNKIKNRIIIPELHFYCIQYSVQGSNTVYQIEIQQVKPTVMMGIFKSLNLRSW